MKRVTGIGGIFSSQRIPRSFANGTVIISAFNPKAIAALPFIGARPRRQIRKASPPGRRSPIRPNTLNRAPRHL